MLRCSREKNIKDSENLLINEAYKMRNVYVAFQFDAEDFITPETDDVLLELINILDNHDVKGSFCIVSEKVRNLKKRGRTDVLESLKRHDIAYQSNLHSVHPVISEYLKDKEWEEGVEEVKKREGPGLELLKRVFDVNPSAFIQPGGSWAPETPYALREMGVPVYVDGIFQDSPVWFCGSLCFKAAMGFPEHSSFADLDALKSRFDEIYNSKINGGLIAIYMHPCMFVTEKFWDAVNFSHGRNPFQGRLMPAPLRSKEKIEESLQVFRAFLSFILEHPNVKVVTFREVAEIYSDLKERRLSLDQIFTLAKRATERNDWQIIDGISISPAEMLRLFVELITNHLQREVEPKSIPIYFTLGPTSKPSETRIPRNINLDDVLEISCIAKKFIDVHSEIPSIVAKDNIKCGPGVLLEVAAKVISYYSEHGSLPERIRVYGLPDIPEVVQRWDLIKRINEQWRWVIFPYGFKSKRIEELTLLQTWTMRPAVSVDNDGGEREQDI